MAFSFSRDRWREYIAKRTTDFSAKVYKDGDRVYAVDSDGKTIAEGEAGVDDASVIQSALDSLTAGRTWKERVVLVGDFLIRDSILIPSYTTLDLSNAFLKLANGIDKNLITNADWNSSNTQIEIIGGILDGNKSNQADNSAGNNCGIHFRNVTYWKINKVYVKNCRVDGFSFWDSPHGKIMECVAEGNGGFGFQFQGAKGYSAGDTKYITVSNCKAYNNGGLRADGGADGFAFGHAYYVYLSNCISRYNIHHGFAGDRADYITLVNCHAEENQQNGFQIADAAGTNPGVGWQLTNCRAINNQWSGFSIINAAEECSLFNCRSINNGQRGIYMAGGVKKITIDGVYCINNGYHGIDVYGNKDTYKVKIIKAQIYSNGSAGNFHGINCAAVSGAQIYDVAIKFCYIGDNTGYDLNVGRASGLISENVLKGSASGVIRFGVSPYPKVYQNIGYTTENSGTVSFSGDGTTTQFSIEHGLVSTPNKVQVTAMSEDASGDFYVTADATYIYVNYKTAPPSGTDNIKLSWSAEV